MSWIDYLPKLIGVQATGSAYMYEAFISNEDILTKPEISADTCADSISSNLPLDRHKALRAVTATCGEFITVSDNEIKEAMIDVARKTGIFNEPASAAAFAGYHKFKNKIDRKKTVVIVATGNGLKDLNTANIAMEEYESKYYSQLDAS